MNSFLLLGIILVLVVGFGEFSPISAELDIPEWVRTTTGFWVQGQISDEEFVTALQYLIDHEILSIPQKQMLDLEHLSESVKVLEIGQTFTDDVLGLEHTIKSVTYEIDYAPQIVQKEGFTTWGVYASLVNGNMEFTSSDFRVFVISNEEYSAEINRSNHIFGISQVNLPNGQTPQFISIEKNGYELVRWILIS
jgi:hypothetical protein